MSNKLSIVISSRETDIEKEDFIRHIKDTCGCEIHLFFLINKDGVGLTKLYSDIMKESENDILLFIHDDIEFLKEGWGKELIRLFNENEEYGIIGIAGSAEFNENGAWWQYPLKYGQVVHKDGDKTWLSAFSPLLDHDLEEVVVIDGLFIGVHKKRISKDFDLIFSGFNHYDTSFCLANFIDKKTKIGVTTNIRLAHNSIGELKDEWYINREILNNKYKDLYPIKINKNND